MKQTSLTIIIALLALFASCQTENQIDLLESPTIEQEADKVPAPEITATQDSLTPTKSLLEVDGEGVGTIYWTPADEINVFYGTTSTHYVSQNASNATTAVFRTTDIIGTTEGASENIWGLYPYNENATCTGTAVTTTLPSTQYGVPGTFDDDLFITLAHNTSTALTFYNVCGGIKFSLSRDDITQITFRGNNNEDIAGEISLNFVDGLPNITVISGQKEVTLTPKTGSTFVSGEYYYLILLPGALTSGFTMIFETEMHVGTFVYTAKPVTIRRSIFGTKEEIDTFASFGSKPVNLSENGTANSYIIPSTGTYKFAAVKGNSNIPVGDVKGVKVLWESFGDLNNIDVGDIINPEAYYIDGEIVFSTNETYREGNAVIAAFSDKECSEGNVLWSWHLWATPVNLDALCQVYNNNVGLLMDRNLGARNNDNNYQFGNQGLLYQWGRKDPFLSGWYSGSNNNTDILTEATSSTDWPSPVQRDAYSTIEYSIAHPMTFIKSSGDWMYDSEEYISSRWGIQKTIYDPCPPGYKVPELNTWIIAYGRNDDLYNFYSYYRGSSYSAGVIADSYVWYPAGYMRDGTTGDYMSFPNRENVYWASNPPTGSSEQPNYGPAMIMTSYDRLVYLKVSQAYGMRPKCNYKSVGAMIRCAKEDNLPIVLVETVELDKSSVQVAPGAQTSLSASVNPSNSNINTVRWESSNTSVATVSDDGTITGVAIGQAIVRAGSSFWRSSNLSYYSGTANCEVKVAPSEPCDSGCYGGWYIQAKAGQSISFDYSMGDGDSGNNNLTVYWMDKIIMNEGGYGDFSGSFSYTFTENYTGWFYMTWGWACELNNVSTTARVIGKGSQRDGWDYWFDDRWISAPSYSFEYRDRSLTIN